MSEADTVRVRLLFVDDGEYEEVSVPLPQASVEGYGRLIDCLREDAEVLKRLHLDVDRLCAAYLDEDDED